MPALVNSSVGSSPGTTGLLATTAWPWLSKYLRKVERISEAFIVGFLLGLAALRVQAPLFRYRGTPTRRAAWASSLSLVASGRRCCRAVSR